MTIPSSNEATKQKQATKQAMLLLLLWSVFGVLLLSCSLSASVPLPASKTVNFDALHHRETARGLEAGSFPPPFSRDLKDGAPVDLLRRLTDFLEVSTGRVWDVQKAKTNRETVKEREERLKNERIEAVRSDPDVRAALAAIPGAEIVEVSDPQPLEATGTEDNVVPLRVASHKKG